MAVQHRFNDGRYEWTCDECGGCYVAMPHRGPRKSVCKACQNNKAYRKRQPVGYRFGRGDIRRATLAAQRIAGE